MHYNHQDHKHKKRDAETKQYSDQYSKIILCLESKDGQCNDDSKCGCYGDQDNEGSGVASGDAQCKGEDKSKNDEKYDVVWIRPPQRLVTDKNYHEDNSRYPEKDEDKKSYFCLSPGP